MKLYSENEHYKLYQGSMLDMHEVIDKESIDSIITDPPYELNFMGKGWDNSGIAFQPDTWKRCFEVLKPGGYLLAFGGSRTFHRIACAIEDAGFEIRDTIMWLYGSGFPKSMDIEKSLNKRDGVEFKSKPASGVGFMNTNDDGYHNTINQLEQIGDSSDRAKKWRGWGTALKPSFEPIIVARKPFKGNLIDNVIEYGVGGINIDECRIETNDNLNGGGYNTKGTSKKQKSDATSFYTPVMKKEFIQPDGRFPANTILTYDENDFDEVCGGFPDTKGGKRHNTAIRKSDKNSGYGFDLNTRNEFNDSGSASRYFYCAKASKKDRDEGLDEFEEKKGIRSNAPRKNEEIKTKPRKNTHPTVKPTELMQYLVRLVSPEGSTILDCFNGSGSTGKAVMYENKEHNKNYKYIGIELTEEYLPIAKARIEYVCNLEPEVDNQTNIFDFIGE